MHDSHINKKTQNYCIFTESIYYDFMLLDFTVANFRSIYQPASLNMVATREQHLRERNPVLSKRYQKTLNPIAGLFGANAAGKSNLLKAMQTLKDLVSNPPRPNEPMPYDPFALEHSASKQPTSFELLFEWNGMMYEYVLCFNAHSVVEEYLTKLLSRVDQEVFAREGDTFSFPYLDQEDSGAEKVRTLLEAVPKKVPLASYVAEVNFGGDVDKQMLEPLLAVSEFLKAVLVVPAGAVDVTTGQFGVGDWQKTITHIDAGIAGVHAEEVEPSAMGVSPEYLREYRQALERYPAPIEAENEHGRFRVALKGDNLVVHRMTLEHDNGTNTPVRLKWSDESDGTKAAARLLELVSVLAAKGARGVLMIDEIDRSFHTELSRALIRGFLNTCEPDSRAQLIFTTHDLLLMDPQILRRDEIWLIEKDHRGQTSATALSDYEGARKDADLRKSYLQGRFGGVPALDPLEFAHG